MWVSNLKGLGSPILVAISLNLACISSDGKYGLNIPLFKEFKFFESCLSLNSFLRLPVDTPK